jgi:hypothetical protein
MDRLTEARIGATAHAVLGGACVRHPSHGGAATFRASLAAAVGQN